MFHKVHTIKDLATDELLTDADLQTLLHISRTTLWRLRKRDNLPYGKVGREYRYRKSEILEWIKDNRARDAQLQIRFPDAD
jgi:excisionase family DNA binding protein